MTNYFPDWVVPNKVNLSEFWNLLQSLYGFIPKQVFSLIAIIGAFALFISFRNKFAGGED